MPTREYRCAECGGTFSHECRGRPRVCCEQCAPTRKMRQIADWFKALTPEQRRAAYDKQREATIARAAAWNRSNPERRAEIIRKYGQQGYVKARARTRNYDRDAREYVSILATDPCSYCGAPCEHIDHIEPLSTGGANTPDNLTAACAACNGSKHAQPLLYFLLNKR